MASVLMQKEHYTHIELLHETALPVFFSAQRLSSTRRALESRVWQLAKRGCQAGEYSTPLQCRLTIVVSEKKHSLLTNYMPLVKL